MHTTKKNMVSTLISDSNMLRQTTNGQIQKKIKQNGAFIGYICGNKVPKDKITDCKYGAVKINLTSVKDFINTTRHFKNDLKINQKQSRYSDAPVFYEVILYI